MTDPSKRLAPSPLRSEPELGALLREANEQYAAGLDEAAAYRRIEEQLPPPSARDRSAFGAPGAAAFLGALAVAGTLVWLKTSGDVGTSIVLGPEERGPATARFAEAAPSEAIAVADTAQDTAALAEPPSISDRDSAGARRALAPRDPPSPTPSPTSARPKPKPDELAPELPKTKPRAETKAEAAAQPKAEERAPELDCMQMARDGAPRAAETCFVTLASGAGLRAEMALHEMARLRRDVLGDASGALAALSEYRQRFPRGSLRHEVALSRVELLVRLGRARDALRESEELLTSPDGRVRAAELHVLRGNMYRTALSDLNAAAAEFARAERLGGALGAEATYLRGTSLEALGDGRAALQAYERYMSTPRRPREAEVRRRIAALAGTSRAAPQAP